VTRKPVVGVLAFQGDFAKHEEAFRKLGCEVRLVKSATALAEIDCLVIPGGESSTIYRFIESERMAEPLRDFANRKPIWGSCAGLILISNEVDNDSRTRPLGLIDIGTSRNAYGRQYESFVAEGQFTLNGTARPMEMVFIRAPKVTRVGDDAEVLGRWQDEVTIVRQGKVVATSFHPELTSSTEFQKFFLSLID
jgi:5'-phosphate synthase pdxT subunit